MPKSESRDDESKTISSMQKAKRETNKQRNKNLEAPFFKKRKKNHIGDIYRNYFLYYCIYCSSQIAGITNNTLNRKLLACSKTERVFLCVSVWNWGLMDRELLPVTFFLEEDLFLRSSCLGRRKKGQMEAVTKLHNNNQGEWPGTQGELLLLLYRPEMYVIKF